MKLAVVVPVSVLSILTENSAILEQWTGIRVGIDIAKSVYGADIAFENTLIDEKIPELMLNKEQVFYLFTDANGIDSKVRLWNKKASGLLRAKLRSIDREVMCIPDRLYDLSKILHEMRVIKSKSEIECLKTSGMISANAHKTLMQNVINTENEYELAALFEYECKKNGSPMLAYPSIVGSGSNACILHYVDNNAKFEKDSLVLIDAGCEVDYYAADITRTFPVNGKFSEAQTQIYNLVLSSQIKGLEIIKPGNTFNQVQETILVVLTTGLVELGLLSGDINKLIEEKSYQRFYMHNSGHWLGLDVHDRGEYKLKGKWREFIPGMVLTVEPGLYIPIADDIPEKYRGIGVRIEDDVLVTETGHEVLTSAVPKSISEIEKVINS